MEIDGAVASGACGCLNRVDHEMGGHVCDHGIVDQLAGTDIGHRDKVEPSLAAGGIGVFTGSEPMRAAQDLSLNPPTGLWDRRFGAGWLLGWCVCVGRRVLGCGGLECGVVVGCAARGAGHGLDEQG